MDHLDFLKNFPDWLRHLAENPAAAELGLTWLSEEDSRTLGFGLAQIYEGKGPPQVPMPGSALVAARELLTTSVAVARGPKVSMRVTRADIESLFFVDRTRPDELLLSLSSHYPPFLWIPVGTSLESIRSALDDYFLARAPSRYKLERIVRAFFGNERMLGTDIHGIENHYVMSPFTSELTWGSALQDDPWPDHSEGNTRKSPTMADVCDKAKQAEGVVYSTSQRLQHSGGVLTLEDHQGLFVVEVRYRPAKSRGVIAAVNKRFDLAFPVDLPIDGVAALFGLALQTEASLKEALSDREQSEDHDLLLHSLSAVKHADLTLADDLRPFMDHPNVSIREAAIDIAHSLDYDALLHPRSVTQTDEEIGVYLDRVLLRDPVAAERVSGPALVLVDDSVPRASIDSLWENQGWELLTEVPRGQKQLFQRLWRTRDGNAKILYIEDHWVGLRFFTVEGQGRNAVLATLHASIASQEHKAVLASAEGAMDLPECIASILKLSRLAPKELDARYLTIIERRLAHENLAVRGAALIAAANIAWPDFVPIIEQRARVDEALRPRAERALSRIRRRDPNYSGG